MHSNQRKQSKQTVKKHNTRSQAEQDDNPVDRMLRLFRKNEQQIATRPK